MVFLKNRSKIIVYEKHRQFTEIDNFNYRLSLCILIANKQKNKDFKELKKLAKNINMTTSKYSKIEAMMLVKCNKTLPFILTKTVSK